MMRATESFAEFDIHSEVRLARGLAVVSGELVG